MNEHLIDANALLNEIVDFKHDAMNADDYNAYDVVEKAIRAMPTVDPESLRPVGRWELFGNDDEVGCSYRCSNCGNWFDEDWFFPSAIPGLTGNKYKPLKYCPNCGAKMED